MCYSEFHKKIRNQLPVISLRESHKKQNATNVAIDMKMADQLISVEKVIEVLNINNILPVYNASFNRINSTKNINSTQHINANEFNTDTKINRIAK